jgi:hypothetical protein
MARKRELIAPHGDKRYVRRDRDGKFTADQVDVGRAVRLVLTHQGEHESRWAAIRSIARGWVLRRLSIPA